MRKNKQTIYKRNLLICILLLFYSIVSPLTYGRTRESLLKPMWQNYCIFEGMLESRENEQVGDRWHKEFDMLKENNTPNFLAMQNILADLVIVPKEEVLKCPKLQNYLSELVNYTESNANYDKISDNIRQVIDYIKWHKLAENTDQSPYHLNIIQAEDQINKNKNDEPPKSIDNNNYHWESCNKYLDNLRINTIHSAY
ncbi:MAG: hypothetical protein KKE11_01490, partial [Gammaproteobacteria bacterium]|nr:hypothetical protein [Gammaproteobacteria bacterium]